MDALLCSQADAARMLNLGKTKISELVAQKKLSTIKIGSRRLVRIDSIHELASIPGHPACEAVR